MARSKPERLGRLAGSMVLAAAIWSAPWVGGAATGEPPTKGSPDMSESQRTWAGLGPQELRVELQTATHPDMRRRRAVVVVSLVGIVMMAIITLFQIGVVPRLPDPPIPGFDSVKVNSSDTAWKYGVPDGTLGLASLAVNLPLAAFGGVARAVTLPWVPVVFAAKTAVDAVIGAWYFYQMPAVERAWCGYCIVGALVNLSVFGLVLPEAIRAAGTLWRG